MRWISNSWMVLGTAIFLGVSACSAAGQSGSAQREESVAWEFDCTSTDGWIDNEMDPEIGTSLRLESGTKGVMIVKQEGKDTWGKSAVLVEGINLNETPILEAMVTKVDKGSGFKLGIAPTDWSTFIEVIKRSSADGKHTGDIEKAVKRAGRKDLLEGEVSFFLVIVIEGKGKASYFEHLKISRDK